MSNPIYNKLEAELKNLPGELAHEEMFPFRKLSGIALKNAADYRISAVIGVLYIDKGRLMLILTERQDYNGKHSGQISFPGGKMEDFDEDTISTALRETHEEIGIRPDKIIVLGKLTDVYIPISKFIVHPYIGYMSEPPEFKLSEREVKSIITFPVHDLLDEKTKVLSKVQNHKGIWLKDIPSFNIQNKAVWGATALMLNEFRIILKRFKT